MALCLNDSELIDINDPDKEVYENRKNKLFKKFSKTKYNVYIPELINRMLEYEPVDRLNLIQMK